jgi:hypothetical protein
MKVTFALLCVLTVLTVSQATLFSSMSMKYSEEKMNEKMLTTSEAPLLYMVNNSRVVPGFNQLLEVDLQNKKYRVVTDKLNGMSDSVSGSALCGDNFFAVITDAPISFGLAKVNVRTGAVEYLDSKDYLFHKIVCDPTDNNTFIGAASQFTTPPTFTIQRYDSKTQTAKTVGTWPSGLTWPGWDSIFSFDFKNNVVLAAFATLQAGVPKGAKLYEMDLKSGSVSGPKPFDVSKAVQSIIASGTDQFIGTVIDADLDQVSLCKFDKSGSSVSNSECKSAQGLHTDGLPYPVCNGKLYSLTQPIQAPGTTCGLYSTDIEGFTVEKLIEIDGFIPYGYVGAMACKGGF